MCTLHTLQQQLLTHLRDQLPALHGQVHLAPAAAAQAAVHVTQPPSPSQQTMCSLWLHGPDWRRNTWASCLPDPIAQQGHRFTRTPAPLAWDLLYDVLILSRCPDTLNAIAMQLCTCIAHAGSITVPAARPQQASAPHTGTTSYALSWDQAALSRSPINTSGWHTLAGRLNIEGVPLHSDAVAQHGSVATQPLQLLGPGAK